MKDRFDLNALFGKSTIHGGFIHWLRELTHGPSCVSESRVLTEQRYADKPKKIMKKSGMVNWVA